MTQASGLFRLSISARFGIDDIRLLSSPVRYKEECQSTPACIEHENQAATIMTAGITPFRTLRNVVIMNQCRFAIVTRKL